VERQPAEDAPHPAGCSVARGGLSLDAVTVDRHIGEFGRDEVTSDEDEEQDPDQAESDTDGSTLLISARIEDRLS
jgi:hypothetical protein